MIYCQYKLGWFPKVFFMEVKKALNKTQVCKDTYNSQYFDVLLILDPKALKYPSQKNPVAKAMTHMKPSMLLAAPLLVAMSNGTIKKVLISKAAKEMGGTGNSEESQRG